MPIIVTLCESFLDLVNQALALAAIEDGRDDSPTTAELNAVLAEAEMERPVVVRDPIEIEFANEHLAMAEASFMEVSNL